MDEEASVNRMPKGVGDDDKKWGEAYSAFTQRWQRFAKARADECGTNVYFDRLKARLTKLRPTLDTSQVHLAGLQIYQDFRNLDEFVADFSVGYDTRLNIPAPPRVSPPVLKK